MPPRKGPVGLSDYKGGGGDDDEDDDKQKKTYVGSGINVLDPKKASAVDKIVHAATEKAKAKAQGGHSAEDEEEDGGAAPPNAVNITFWKIIWIKFFSFYFRIINLSWFTCFVQ